MVQVNYGTYERIRLIHLQFIHEDFPPIGLTSNVWLAGEMHVHDYIDLYGSHEDQ